MTKDVPRIEDMSPNLLLKHYLMHSYLYYIKDTPVISDHEYDLICRRLLERWDGVDHPHKYLTREDALRAGTAFHLSEEAYPLITRSAAMQLYAQLS